MISRILIALVAVLSVSCYTLDDYKDRVFYEYDGYTPTDDPILSAYFEEHDVRGIFETRWEDGNCASIIDDNRFEGYGNHYRTMKRWPCLPFIIAENVKSELGACEPQRQERPSSREDQTEALILNENCLCYLETFTEVYLSKVHIERRFPDFNECSAFFDETTFERIKEIAYSSK